MYDTFLSLITWVPRSNRPWNLICWKSFGSSSLIDNLCWTEYIAAKLTEIRFGLLVRCTKCLHLTNSLEKLNEKFVYCKSASWHVGFNGKDSKPETYICVVSQQVFLSNTLCLSLSRSFSFSVFHTPWKYVLERLVEGNMLVVTASALLSLTQERVKNWLYVGHNKWIDTPIRLR